MPDDEPSDPVEQKAIEQRPGAEQPNPPPPPNDPSSPPAQGISRQEVQSEVKGIEDRVKRAELWMIWLTAAIAFSGFCAVGVGLMQWHEIHTGSTDTHDLAVAAKAQAEKMQSMSDAADKIRQAAENMVVQDQRIADNSQNAMEASNSQSKSALDASIAASRLDQRAWVMNSGVQLDAPETGKKLHGYGAWRNTGKTLAKKVKPLCHLNFSREQIGSEAELMKEVTPTAPSQPSIGVLAPGAEYKTLLESQGIINEDLKTQISESLYTYVWGEITYEDIFGLSHTTVFCSWRKGSTGEFFQCAYHNNAT